MPLGGDNYDRNLLLALLPDDLGSLFGDEAEVVELDLRDTVFERDQSIEHVLFPLTGVISLVAGAGGDEQVEIATVGREGMVGLPVFLQSAYTSAHTAFCQVRCEAVTVKVSAFQDALARSTDLNAVLHRYTQALFTQVAQTAACNAVHDITQRSARWILLTHDRVDGDEFELTQAFLAQMLGVQRTGVNAAAQALQDAGCIRYVRGNVEVLDRDRLLALSCPCYGIVREEFDRLVPG